MATENNRLRISSTNLEIGINCWVPGKIEKDGSITVPAKLLSGFIGNLPNKKIELKTKDSQLYLGCENFKAVLRGIDAKDFPIIPKIKNSPLIKIKSEVLKTALAQVAEMAAISEVRPEISGVFVKIEKDLIKFAATDSFRLAEKIIYQNKLVSARAGLVSAKDGLESLNHSLIIPQRTILELVRILGEKDLLGAKEDQEVEVILGGNQILFDLGYSQVVSRLIEGQYPDYQQIIPKNLEIQATLNRNELINGIKIASLFSGKVNNIKLSIQPKKSLIEISAKDTDIGENKSQLNAKIEGKEVEITFNYRYLLDGLNNIFSDKVILGLNSASNPVVIKPVGDTSYTYLVMPIKA